MKAYSLFLFILISMKAFTQPGVEWFKATNNQNTDDWLGSITQSSDGNIIIGLTGYFVNPLPSDYHGAGDFYLEKYDINGNLLWGKCYGSSENDYLFDVKATPDGGCLAVGTTYGNDGDVSGNTGTSCIWVVKVNSNGIVQWKKCLGNTSWEDGYAATVGTDGYYYITGSVSASPIGSTGYHDAYDILVVKLSPTGVISWQKCFGGSDDEECYDIISLSNGNLLLCGYSYSTDGDIQQNKGECDALILSITTSGSVVFCKTIGGSDDDTFFSVAELGGSSCALAGYTYSSDGDIGTLTGNSDLLVARISSTGSTSWIKTFGKTDEENAGYFLSKTIEGNIIIPDISIEYFGDFYSTLYKLDGNGNKLWSMEYHHDYGFIIVSTYITSNNDLYIAGTGSSYSGAIPVGESNFIAKLGNVNSISSFEKPAIQAYYENGCISFINMDEEIKWAQIIDITGKNISISIQWNRILTTQQMSPGVYFYNVNSQNLHYSGKLVIPE